MSLIEQPIDEPNTEIIYVDETESDKFANNSLDSVISELGGDSLDDILLKIYRINKVTKKEEFCFNSCPEELPLEPRLVSEYGSGEFTVRVMVPNEQGRKSLKRRLNISIAERLNSYVEPVRNDSGDIKEIMSGMMEAMSQNQTNMMQMFKESQLESQNKTQELLISVLSNKSDDKQPTLLETMAALKALTPDTKDPMEVFGQMLTMNREIKAEMTPETPPAEGSFGQLMEGANKLMDMASNAPKAPPQQAQQRTAENQQRPAIQSPEQQEKEQTDMNTLMRMRLKSNLNMLNEKAKAGSNSALWADVTIDEVPEQYYPQLIAALGDSDEQGFINLMSINPVIEPNKDWFISFIGEIRAAFVESKEPEIEPETEPDLTDDTVLGDDSENKDISISEPEIDTTDNVDTQESELSNANESNT